LKFNLRPTLTLGLLADRTCACPTPCSSLAQFAALGCRTCTATTKAIPPPVFFSGPTRYRNVFLVNQLVFKIKTGASVSGARGLPFWWVNPIRAEVNVRFNECKPHCSDLLSAAVPLHSHVRADCGRKPRLGSGDALDGQWACPCGDIATGGLGKRRCACLKVSLDVVPVTILLWSLPIRNGQFLCCNAPTSQLSKNAHIIRSSDRAGGGTSKGQETNNTCVGAIW